MYLKKILKDDKTLINIEKCDFQCLTIVLYIIILASTNAFSGFSNIFSFCYKFSYFLLQFPFRSNIDLFYILLYIPPFVVLNFLKNNLI